LLPRMACIFFLSSLSPFFPMAMEAWSVIGMGYFFYSRDPSFMSLIDSPLFVKFSKMANFNFRESWFDFFLFSEIRLWKRCSKYMDFVLQTGGLSHINV
jgi:hypothetical protein